MAIKTHPLVPLALVLLAASASEIVGEPVTLFGLPLELEVALSPNFSLVGTLTPTYGSLGASSAFGGALAVGARYYFYGVPPDGAFAGVNLAYGVVSGTPASGTAVLTLPFVGFDAQAQAGYQWVFGSGFTVALVGTWSPVNLATGSATGGLGFQVPLGFAF